MTASVFLRPASKHGACSPRSAAHPAGPAGGDTMNSKPSRTLEQPPPRADPAGAPLHYTLHDFRRMFHTGAKIGGVASDATFPGKRERPWPALRPLESSPRAGQGGQQSGR